MGLLSGPECESHAFMGFLHTIPSVLNVPPQQFPHALVPRPLSHMKGFLSDRNFPDHSVHPLFPHPQIIPNMLILSFCAPHLAQSKII